MSKKNLSSRRQFLATTTAAAAATTLLAPRVFAAENETIKVGLIGCGGRGSGAARDVLSAARGVEIIALGDFFKHKAEGLRKGLGDFLQSPDGKAARDFGNKVNVEDGACFGGLDAYEKVIGTPGINYIILATPPGFRPLHIQAAVAAGKNIFTEKPVGVDGPGIRKVLEAYETANTKKLCIAAGTQRRHQLGYQETIKKLHDGVIGDIVAGRCFWNQGNIWFNKRGDQMTDLQYQIHNWYHFLWLCGDHIVEQHVHNLDVINWVLGKPPLRALGMGGRTRPYKDPNVDGNIFNFFAVDYEYPNGVHVLSMSRQINGTDGNLPGLSGVSEAVQGTKGFCQVNAYTINGKQVEEATKPAQNPYVQEHTDLIASIREGKPINELKNVAESTLTAIMGRMSAYTGKAVTWDQALNSKLDTFPAKLNEDVKLVAAPLPEPGKTRLN